MKVFLRKAQLRMAHNGLLEWSTNGAVWYPIGNQNVKAALPEGPESPEKKLASYRQKFNRIFQGKTESFEHAQYNRELRTLSILA
jgi:hypothetical protein